MWKLYDTLISHVPEHVLVEHVHMGPVWTIVHAGSYCGIAVTVNEQEALLPPCSHLVGASLRDVARLCKSWDFPMASVGTAALNAFYNSPQTLRSLPGLQTTENGFIDYADAVANKKAAVIGHFFTLENHLAQAASVSVLERKPWPGDYPDSACEYILPGQDFVFITGSAFVNKTLPRLLQLSVGGKAIVLGPSTPISPVLFDFGADELSGLSPDFLSLEQTVIVGQGNVKMSRYGTRVRLTPQPAFGTHAL